MPAPTIGDSGPRSLAEVNSSVATAHRPFWRRMLAFAGPAYLVSVGYMDPGNWATDLEGGARFGYDLLWVLILSNLMAILLQTLSARLGIVTNLDLAQACRQSYPRPVALALWVLCEIAIAACDLAEVLGAAIGINLLFHIPLLFGVGIAAADTLLLLWLGRFGIRAIEGMIISLVAVITACFLTEIYFAQPSLPAMVAGIVPRLTNESLYVAIGILGATVMPHNLYLHSALVQTRQIGRTDEQRREACRFNLVDSLIALNGALIVNAAILVLAAAVFHTRGLVVTELKEASQLLAPLLGTTWASVLFAVALLCSGQSSTITGTMAGQIVMEGFLHLRLRPWLRRAVTRLLAVVPAVFVIVTSGEAATYQLLIFSQVVLSMQLPFAIIPLIHFTSDKRRMGPFANRPWVQVISWLSAALIVGLNLRLAWSAIHEPLGAGLSTGSPLAVLAVLGLAALLLLLAWVALEPMLASRRATQPMPSVQLPPVQGDAYRAPTYRTLMVPLDHTDLDQEAVAHAAAIAKQHAAKLYLLHVEEDVTSQVYGEMASTAEVEAGRDYLNQILAHLHSQGIAAEALVRFNRRPDEEIIRAVRELQPDLLVMGAHGHRGWRDLVYGSTINHVRHRVGAPVLIVRRSPGR